MDQILVLIYSSVQNVRKIAGKKQPASKMPRAAASKVETKAPRGKRGAAVKKEPETSVLQGMEKLSVKEIVAMKEGLTGNISPNINTTVFITLCIGLHS